MIDFGLLYQSLPALLKGAVITLQIAVLACFLGLLLGFILGICQSFGGKFLWYCTQCYSSVVRGTPMLVQIIFVFYVLPQFGVSMNAYWVAVLVIGCNSGGYVGQIVRAGIASVPKGQIEAAKVLKLSRFQIIWYIILPPAMRIILPGLGNELITLIKDTSLASVIGVMELSREGSIIRSRTYDPLTVLFAVALLYFIMTTVLTWFVTKIENRMNHYVEN